MSTPPIAAAPRRRFDYRHLAPTAATDEGWQTVRVLVPREEISHVVGLFEAYENEFLVRTETKGLGYLRIWFPAIHRRQFDAILAEMQTEYPVEVLEITDGMSALDEVFPE